MKFDLLKNIHEEGDEQLIFEENCKLISQDSIEVLVESAEKILGQATAALKAGKNPFYKQGAELPALYLVRGLMALRSKQVRDAAGITDVGMKTIAAQLGDVVRVNNAVTKIGQGQKSLLTPEMLTDKTQIAQLTKDLDKLRMAFAKLQTQAPQQKPAGQAPV